MARWPTRRAPCSGAPISLASRLHFAKHDALITAVAQDAVTGAVLMVAHADWKSIERTEATGEMHYRALGVGLGDVRAALAAHR